MPKSRAVTLNQLGFYDEASQFLSNLYSPLWAGLWRVRPLFVNEIHLFNQSETVNSERTDLLSVISLHLA
jgi:hypothetical protein